MLAGVKVDPSVNLRKGRASDELGALRLKPILAERAKEKQLETLKQNATVSQNSVERKPMDTQKDLATIAGVSHDTIHKVETSTPLSLSL